MAQRKPTSGGKPAAKKGTSRPAGKPGAGSTAKVSTAKVSTAKVPASSAAAARKQPPRKPGKSIVNQKQTPWGTIITVLAVIAFAGAVIGIVIATHKSSNPSACGSANANYCKPEIKAAKDINGVNYKVETNHTHIVTGTVKYDMSPPIGGNHSPYWADCNGTVYSEPIANENAVHPLEHGAVWVTYKQGLPQSEVDTLAKDVQGQQYVFMSPYPNLKTNVSLQAWDYQLFVNSVTDPRITDFIAALSHNPDTTPEYGASCDQPTFKAAPSTWGHPLFAPQAPTSSAASTPGSSTSGSSAP
jgi:hypothetical protein